MSFFGLYILLLHKNCNKEQKILHLKKFFADFFSEVEKSSAEIYVENKNAENWKTGYSLDNAKHR